MPNNIKQQIMDEIQKRSEIFIPSSNTQYRIRCPICGDSQKDLRDAHCYLKCSNDPTEPILYHCFLCNSGGQVGKWFLDKIGIDPDLSAQIGTKRFNRLSQIKSKRGSVELITGKPILNSPQANYIALRLGCTFTEDELDAFKIVWDPHASLDKILDRRTLNTLPSTRDAVMFVSDDKSVLMVRSFIDTDGRWRKIRLFETGTKAFYTIKCTMDLFTKDEIIVNIAEGIMDVISAYKNFGAPNSAYIATVGSNYLSAVDYAISKGLIGKNVTVKIYMDHDINERDLKRSLRPYKWLFGKIVILKNVIGKDIGVPINKIQLSESKV